MQLTLRNNAELLYQDSIIAGFCFLAWTSGLEKYSMSKLVVIFFATLPPGVVFSSLILNDELTLSLLGGTAFVAAGKRLRLIFVIKRL